MAARTGRDVTPPQIGPWWKISLIDASHFDAKTAYAAVNTIRLDDLRPHIYRTNDDGKTWQEIVRGIPNDENVNAVREDPQRRGLLFAGTERGGLRLVRRRRQLAIAPPQHARDFGARSDREG